MVVAYFMNHHDLNSQVSLAQARASFVTSVFGEFD